ncbi:MAG TPA: hypothetical protein VK629_00555 [Steroidobacteraceae bacterium]|nr:hypothetical protein [Steroidobacteraceae bacterium]
MQDPTPDRLDQLLGSLPRDVVPKRNQWPDIRAALDAQPEAPNTGREAHRPSFAPLWTQLAAAVVLVAMTAVITYSIARREFSAQPTLAAVSGSDDLAVEYLRAREALDRAFAERVATLPPATRAKLEGNLADLRRAGDEIVATLAQHPSDPLLEELLISTRYRELQLMADVAQLDDPIS